MHNFDKFDTIEKHNTSKVSPVWQRFLDYGQKFSVEQVDFANSSDSVNAKWTALLNEYVMFYMFQDKTFCEIERYRLLCDSFIDEFIKQGSECANNLKNELVELRAETDRLKKQLAEAKSKPTKAGSDG